MAESKISTKGKAIPATQSKAKVGAAQRKKSLSGPQVAMSHELIAARAYQIWESSGYPGECELEHWVAAERELRGRFA
jgi:hypothetical protein